jgi:glycosyltransferase involved in cell wall biosynthesis
MDGGKGGMEHARVLVVIPALNEAANIRPAIQGILDLQEPWDILVVDDGSTDATAARAAALGVDVLRLPFRIGIGGAVSSGLCYAAQKKYDAVIRVDADGQHDPQFMREVLAPVLRGSADLCVGSRFTGLAAGYPMSWVRRAGIIFFSKLISALTGDRVTDPTSGFCAFSARAVRLFAEHYPSDYPEPEAIVIARRAGLMFREVPAVMKERVSGLSSIRYLRTFYYMLKVTLAIMLNYLRKAKTLDADSAGE